MSLLGRDNGVNKISVKRKSETTYFTNAKRRCLKEVAINFVSPMLVAFDWLHRAIDHIIKTTIKLRFEPIL